MSHIAEIRSEQVGTEEPARCELWRNYCIKNKDIKDEMRAPSSAKPLRGISSLGLRVSC